MPLIVLLLLALCFFPLWGAWAFLVTMGVDKVLSGGMVALMGVLIMIWLTRGYDA